MKLKNEFSTVNDSRIQNLHRKQQHHFCTNEVGRDDLLSKIVQFVEKIRQDSILRIYRSLSQENSRPERNGNEKKEMKTS